MDNEHTIHGHPASTGWYSMYKHTRPYGQPIDHKLVDNNRFPTTGLNQTDTLPNTTNLHPFYEPQHTTPCRPFLNNPNFIQDEAGSLVIDNSFHNLGANMYKPIDHSNQYQLEEETGNDIEEEGGNEVNKVTVNIGEQEQGRETIDNTQNTKARPRRKHKKYDPVLVREFLGRIERGEMSLRAAGRLAGIPHSTFLGYKKKPHTIEQSIGAPLVLTPEHEIGLGKAATMLLANGVPLTKNDVLRNADYMAKLNSRSFPTKDGRPGHAWWDNFCKRSEKAGYNTNFVSSSSTCVAKLRQALLEKSDEPLMQHASLLEKVLQEHSRLIDTCFQVASEMAVRPTTTADGNTEAAIMATSAVNHMLLTQAQMMEAPDNGHGPLSQNGLTPRTYSPAHHCSPTMNTVPSTVNVVTDNKVIGADEQGFGEEIHASTLDVRDNIQNVANGFTALPSLQGSEEIVGLPLLGDRQEEEKGGGIDDGRIKRGRIESLTGDPTLQKRGRGRPRKRLDTMPISSLPELPRSFQDVHEGMATEEDEEHVSNEGEGTVDDVVSSLSLHPSYTYYVRKVKLQAFATTS